MVVVAQRDAVVGIGGGVAEKRAALSVGHGGQDGLRRHLEEGGDAPGDGLTARVAAVADGEGGLVGTAGGSPGGDEAVNDAGVGIEAQSGRQTGGGVGQGAPSTLAPDRCSRTACPSRLAWSGTKARATRGATPQRKL